MRLLDFYILDLEDNFMNTGVIDRDIAVTLSTTAILREQIYNFINRSGNAGVTDEEIAFNFDLAGDTARPRRNELVQANLIANSGVRRHTSSGRAATVWKSTRVMNKLAATTALTATTAKTTKAARSR